MAKRNAGGGHGSSVVKNNREGRKVEPRPHAVSPGSVSQIGQFDGKPRHRNGGEDEALGRL